MSWGEAEEAQGKLIAAPSGAEGVGGQAGSQLTWGQFNSQLFELEPASWRDPAKLCSSPGQHGCTWSLQPPAKLETLNGSQDQVIFLSFHLFFLRI